MNGKDKCKILKQIRKEIAERNDIEWTVSECRHKGNCKGTCPKCEAEVRKLERELSLRSRLGKAVAVTGISALCITGLSACSLSDANPLSLFDNNVQGDMTYIEDLAGAIDTEPYIEQLDGEVASTYYDDNTENCGSNKIGANATNGQTEYIETIELSGDVAIEE